MSDLELDEPHLDGSMISDPFSESAESQSLPSWCPSDPPLVGIRLGVLVGMTGDGRIPLVVFPGQRGSAAVSARSTQDLHGAHIGLDVVLLFEEGDPARPIIMGCICPRDGASVPSPGSVEIDRDGERLLVTAKDQLVLRCGRATITLTRAGKVLIEGTYISSRSSGVNRIKGGSVKLN